MDQDQGFKEGMIIDDGGVWVCRQCAAACRLEMNVRT